ncbi:MAG: DUF488 domain-containing protein [Thermodesulfovibrionia bacterium]
MRRVYTLGTDLRSLEDFMEILSAYGIEAVIDVRSFPTSKLEHFKRPNLEVVLKDEMFEYHHLGRKLGGFRRGGYRNYTHTIGFKEGVDELEEIASRRSSVIICAERFPWRCHRRFISSELQRRGWEVHHIIDKGRVWIPS